MTKAFCQTSHNFLKGILLFRSKLAQPQLVQWFKIWFLILKVTNCFLYNLLKICMWGTRKEKKMEWIFLFKPQLKLLSWKNGTGIWQRIFIVNNSPIFLWCKSAKLTAQAALNLSLEPIKFCTLKFAAEIKRPSKNNFWIP